MTESTMVLIEQVLMMFVLMAVGFLLFKMKVIDTKGAAQMADVVVYVSTPALTVSALSIPFDATVILNALFCFVVTLGIMIGSAGIARLVFKETPESGLSRYGVVFSNVGFIGIPLVRSVLGEQYVFGLTACNLSYTVLLWTYGIVLISGDKSQVSIKNILINPAVFSIAIGLVCFCTGLRFPAPVEDAIVSLGDINTGLVMLVLGTYVAQVDFRQLIVRKRIYAVSLMRLVMVPLLTIGVLMLFPFVEFETRLTVLIALATPVAALAAVFSKKFDRCSELGIGLVSMSTVLSLVTMPLMLMAGLAVLAA